MECKVINTRRTYTRLNAAHSWERVNAQSISMRSPLYRINHKCKCGATYNTVYIMSPFSGGYVATATITDSISTERYHIHGYNRMINDSLCNYRSCFGRATPKA